LAIDHPNQLMQADRPGAAAAARRPIAVGHNDQACGMRAETPGDLSAPPSPPDQPAAACRSSRGAEAVWACVVGRDEDGAPWSNSATVRRLHVPVGDLRCRRGDGADRELSQRLMSSEDRCLTQR
jgi:hypothetical protein